MDQTTIKAVDMTRHIRNQHADELQGKTPAEIIAFYQEKAEELHTKRDLPVLPTQSVDGVNQTK